MVTGVGLGPFVVGMIRDASSYRSAYLTMSGVALVGLLIFRAAGSAPTLPEGAVDDAPDIERSPAGSRTEPDSVAATVGVAELAASATDPPGRTR